MGSFFLGNSQGNTAKHCWRPSSGTRRKTLPDSYAARQFYSRMFKAGKNPAVVYKEKSQAG
jgi:hypothetical protein